MDPMTMAGIVIAIATTFVACTMAGIPFFAIMFADIGSIVLVVGGSIGASLASYSMADGIAAGKVAVKALMPKKAADGVETIKQLLVFAEQARKEGLLALEAAAKDVADPFLRKGLMMSIDGTDPEVVREVLETEISSVQGRHATGAAFFTSMAGYSPAFGVAGTVIGLMAMLQNLSDPSALGPAMAVAFATTLWGSFLANYIFTPMASKLQRMSALEIAHKELILEGILAIQAGSGSRMVADRLAAYLTPSQQAVLLEKKSA